MAHFLEQYTHMIKSCEDYDSLANAIDTCIYKNVMNHVSMDLKNAIDSLPLNTSYSKFVKSLVWASTVSDYEESSLNILRYFCNKAVSEFDSLIIAPDDFSIMVFAVCADDKQFIKKLPKEKKIILAKELCHWYLCLTDKDINDECLFGALANSMDLIVDGKTMVELDKEFKDWHKNTTIDTIGTAETHQSSQILRPFQALFINVNQNIDQTTLLNQLNIVNWEKIVEQKIDESSKRYTKKSSNNSSYDCNYTFLRDILIGFDMFNRKLVSTGYTKLPNPVVGEFLFGFLNVLHQNYQHNDYTTDEISMLLKDAQRIYLDNFAVSDSVRNIINLIVASYCESGDFEDKFFKDKDYFDSIKFHLRNSELFKVWIEDSKFKKYSSLPDVVYATYLHHFLNPELDLADTLIAAQEQSLDIATEARRPIAVRNSRSSIKDEQDEDTRDNDPNEDESYDNNEDNPPEDDNDQQDYQDDEAPEEYDGPEINARQSTKGYKRASKRQSDGERKIYGAYKKYKDNEAKVDSQLSKMLASAKRAFSQDKTEEIIEGKKFTPIGLLKKIFVTAAIFNYNKVAGFVYLLVSHTISKKRTIKQKNEILIQIDTELKMIDEKIEDARGDGNRKAKYALMRTKAELERARDKIKYNLTATKNDMKVAKKYVNNPYRDNV